jgi:hypothetical protein
MKELECTFKEWLLSKKLDALIPFFIYSQAAQGYGSLNVVPALYGLWWTQPEYIGNILVVPDLTLFAANLIVNGVAGIRLPMWILSALGWIGGKLMPLILYRPFQSPVQAVLKSGFEKLWQTIVEKEKLDIKLNCPVKMIDRSGDRPIVTYTDKEAATEKTITDADFVVVCSVSHLRSALCMRHRKHTQQSL